jgi:hypothetical protein
MSRERFLERVNNASNCNDLLDVLALLPNTAQRWGHSITMNAIIKILYHRPTSMTNVIQFMQPKGEKVWGRKFHQPLTAL